MAHPAVCASDIFSKFPFLVQGLLPGWVGPELCGPSPLEMENVQEEKANGNPCKSERILQNELLQQSPQKGPNE